MTELDFRLIVVALCGAIWVIVSVGILWRVVTDADFRATIEMPIWLTFTVACLWPLVAAIGPVWWLTVHYLNDLKRGR